MLKKFYAVVGLFIVLFSFFSCRHSNKPKDKDIVKKVELLDERIGRDLKAILNYSNHNAGRINDTLVLRLNAILNSAYEKNSFSPLWSRQGNWKYIGESLLKFIEESKKYGLFPSDYHLHSLSGIQQKLLMDSTARKDAALWARADVLMTDAFFLASRHMKQGRLEYDSLTIHKDTTISDSFYLQVFDQLRQSNNAFSTLETLEPKQIGYLELKAGIKAFLDSAQFKRSTYLGYPPVDTANFRKLLQRRLFELDLVQSATSEMDTATWRAAIQGYQVAKKLKPTGRINESTVNSLNLTDWEKFKRIALTVDKYKLLPDTMPATYVWVNIPAYLLKVISHDTLVFESKIIVGAPKTRTPELNAEISNFITYPQWTVPYSIIYKEMLPAIQKDIGYLEKQNLMVVGKDDTIIDPATVKWSKLSKKYFPYQIKQREGDDNSLGVLKFNFRNKYDVYLHDTNARWLFSRGARALSHGCVRVKEWEDLANFLVRNNTERYPPDTLASWILRQEKHTVYGFSKVPIFIRYFTCEGKYGKLVFYDDVYGEDKLLSEKYFSDKSIN